MENLEIKTGLIDKEYVFDVIALAEASGIPLLLIGVPGTSKTACVLDYAKARHKNLDHEELMDTVFILETDEATRPAEVKGRIDLKKMIEDQTFAFNSPITRAEYIVINEIDKASASLRNSLLGVMNEKILFNGTSNVPCLWKSFVATCNIIPTKEVDSPFWDRFMLKLEVKRISAQAMKYFYENGDKRAFSTVHSVSAPTKEEINNVVIPEKSLIKMVDVIRDKVSDRTLATIPHLVRCATLVWNIHPINAIIKIVELVCDSSVAVSLSGQLTSAEITKVMNKSEMISAATRPQSIGSYLGTIKKMIDSDIKSDDDINLCIDITVKAIMSNRHIEDEQKKTFMDKFLEGTSYAKPTNVKTPTAEKIEGDAATADLFAK